MCAIAQSEFASNFRRDLLIFGREVRLIRHPLISGKGAAWVSKTPLAAVFWSKPQGQMGV
jgi:hypothetical protein